jgi:hypothetical protein
VLKEGRQKEHFLSALSRVRPELVQRCRDLYAGDQWGGAVGGYYPRLARMFGRLAREHGVFPRIPRALFDGLLRESDLPIVPLDQVHAMLEMLGEPTRYGYAAFQLSRGAAPDGVRLDSAAARLVEEIGRTGTAGLYEDLLSRFSTGAAAAR